MIFFKQNSKLLFKKLLYITIISYILRFHNCALLFLDDIITPVYVAPTRLPTTLRPKLHKEKIQERPSCDDEEDCEEGSGDPRTTPEEIFVTSTSGPYYRILFCFLSHFYVTTLKREYLKLYIHNFMLKRDKTSYSLTYVKKYMPKTALDIHLHF